MAYNDCPKCAQPCEQPTFFIGLEYVRNVYWCPDCELLWLRYRYAFYSLGTKIVVLKSNHGPDKEVQITTKDFIRSWKENDGGDTHHYGYRY